MKSCTYRTLPRDDGKTSVVLTADPMRPSDPEVVKVFESSIAATNFVIERTKKVAGAAKVPVLVTLRLEYEARRARVVATIARAEQEAHRG